MYLTDHMTSTNHTAAYPDAGQHTTAALCYLTLGLAGEASETLEKAAADHPDRNEIQTELGDTLWYINRLHLELNLNPDTALAADALTPGPDTTDTWTDPTAQLVIDAGRVAELIKKTLRDDHSVLTASRHAALRDQLTRTLTTWIDANRYWGLEPSHTAAANLEKLADRKARGALTGSGDHR